MNFINNPWFIGVVGGIFSGLIVFFITKYLLSARDKREYLQKVNMANKEIISNIRSSIAEKIIPPVEIILSVINSISHKYEIHRKDLYSIRNLVNDLIAEVMSNSFLSSEDKDNFCKLILEINVEYEKLKEIKDTTYKLRETLTQSSISFELIFSIILSTIVAILVATLFVHTDQLNKIILYILILPTIGLFLLNIIDKKLNTFYKVENKKQNCKEKNK